MTGHKLSVIFTKEHFSPSSGNHPYIMSTEMWEFWTLFQQFAMTYRTESTQTPYPKRGRHSRKVSLGKHRRVRVESPNVPEFPWISDTPIWPKWGESADELWHHRVSWRGKYKIIQSERVSKLEKWEGLNGQHLRAGNSTTEGFETVNGNQGHSTLPLQVYYFLRPQVGGSGIPHSRVKSAPCANRGASELTG